MKFSAAAVFLLLSGITQSMAQSPSPSAESLGVQFIEGSTSSVVLLRDGKRYVVDLANRSVTEAPENESQTSSSRQEAAMSTPPPAPAEKAVYKIGDDQLFTVPTGRPVDRHGLHVNFTHRFAFESAFEGTARGHTLLGLDDFSISSFGIRYGITSRLSAFVYRAPSFIGRPIELMGAYVTSSEADGAPLNSTARISVDGQNDFSRNFTINFEEILSRSLGKRAQIYLVPTLSLHNRPLTAFSGNIEAPPPYQPCSAPAAPGVPAGFGHVRPCANTFALGTGLSVDVRRTVALIAEGEPVLANGTDLGIHRVAFAFGIQKKIWRHAFTFGFTNSPGTTVAQRISTRATYLSDPSADKIGKMFVGFDLTRQVR